MSSKKRLLPALTGVRFFLAFWVVAYHQEGSLDEYFRHGSFVLAGMKSLLHTGYSAVSAFFILSGFVLSYNYDLEALARGNGVWKFAVARFSRIYPAYLMGTLLLLPLAFYRIHRGIPIDETGGLPSLILNLCLLQAWVPSVALTWNYPGWSLSDETFFYTCLPLIGAFFYRLGSRAKPDYVFSLPRLFLAALALWLCSLAVPLYTVLAPIHGFGDVPATIDQLPDFGIWPGLVRYNPLIRLPEFCLGILLAALYRNAPAEHVLWRKGVWLYLGGIAISLTVLVNADAIPYPPMHNGLLAPAYAMIILGLALGGGFLARFFSLPVFVFLGNASYSMYILHAPVYTWLKLVFTRLMLIPADGAVWFACYLVTVCGVACIVYRFVEEPMHMWLKTRLSPRAQQMVR